LIKFPSINFDPPRFLIFECKVSPKTISTIPNSVRRTTDDFPTPITLRFFLNLTKERFPYLGSFLQKIPRERGILERIISTKVEVLMTGFNITIQVGDYERDKPIFSGMGTTV